MDEVNVRDGSWTMLAMRDAFVGGSDMYWKIDDDGVHCAVVHTIGRLESEPVVTTYADIEEALADVSEEESAEWDMWGGKYFDLPMTRDRLRQRLLSLREIP